MTPEAMARILVALEIEHRSERAYDEADPGHVVMPNGSLVASFDRAFLGAAAREASGFHAAFYATPRTKENAA